MEKVDLTKQFAHRLKEAMVAAGLNSQHAVSGVSINKLAQMTDHSLQICRRYMRGESIPEPQKLVELAQKLKVSAGWLLFGESEHDLPVGENNIIISKKLLRYILSQSKDLYTADCNKEDMAAFLMDLIQDVCHINANEEQSKKIIDLALSSVKHFKKHGK